MIWRLGNSVRLRSQ